MPTETTIGITGWGIPGFNPNCPTCVWLKQHRNGVARKDHLCGIEFSQNIHDSQIRAEKDTPCRSHPLDCVRIRAVDW
jgi:hypothetical protein